MDLKRATSVQARAFSAKIASSAREPVYIRRTMPPPPSHPDDDRSASTIEPSSKRMGRPKMPEAPAERVREVLRKLLAEKFDGNKAALARALGRSATAVTDLLEANANPSFDSVCKIAALAGCTEGELFFGDKGTPVPINTSDPHPNLTSLLRRLDGLLPTEIVRVLHQHIPVGSPDLSEERWFDTLIALKVAQSLGTLLPWPKRKGE